jgi:hypothetical protein
MSPIGIISSTERLLSDDEIRLIPPPLSAPLRYPDTWVLLPYYKILERNIVSRTSKVEIKFITNVSSEGHRYEMFLTVIIDNISPIAPRLKQIHWITRKKYIGTVLVSYDEHRSLKQAVFSYISPYPVVEWTSIKLGANTYGVHAIIFCALIKRIKYIETNLM